MQPPNAEPAAVVPVTRSQGKARKRAPKACLSCRARKVRCDVSQRGRPCMNCYLDSETCVVTGRASRLRRARENGLNNETSFPPYPPVNGDERHSAEAIVKSRLEGLTAPCDTAQSDPTSLTSGPGKQDHSHQTTELGLTMDTAATTCQPVGIENPQGGSNSSNAFHQYSSADSRMQTIHHHQPLMHQSPNNTVANDKYGSCITDVVYSYYPFLIVGNLSNIPAQDVNYLDSQACLRVPTRSLLDEFLQQYFLHVHPLLPLINEGEFWAMYSNDGYNIGISGQAEHLSLLVFQAILFASCNFVSKQTIKALGFSCIRTARASLYRRAKLLHDLETESSPLALSQACLLLSFWAPSSTRKPNTSWLSLAIQHAKSAEAHHYAAMPQFSPLTHPLQHRKQNILKRLWWGCIIRDRCLGLLMRRPLQITKSHFDFDSNPTFALADLASEFGTSRVYDADTKRCLAEVLAQIIELYIVLTDILLLVFPLDDTPGWGRRMTPDDAGRVSDCKESLRRWYKDTALRFPMLSGEADFGASKSNTRTQYRHGSSILYTNLMYMYYHSARVVLGHYEILHLAILQAVPDGDEGSRSRDLSVIYENRHELQDAASGVTECLKELVHLKLARWLPISAVACTALPLMLNILDVKLSSPSANSAMDSDTASASKQHRLNILIEAMRTYQPQYDGVDWVSEIVRHIVNLAQIDGPSASTSSASAKPPINDWTDILAQQPSSYLRLALALDLSLSKGRLPEDGDFPVSLRGLFTGGFSPLRALVEATRSGDVREKRVSQADRSHKACDSALYSPSTRPHMVSSLYLAKSSEASDEGQGPDTHSPASGRTNPESSCAPPSEGIAGLGNDGSDVFTVDGSPSAASGYEGMYIDGPMPDISAVWIENLWDEIEEVQDKTDRDTARVLLEALKEGDMSEYVM